MVNSGLGGQNLLCVPRPGPLTAALLQFRIQDSGVRRRVRSGIMNGELGMQNLFCAPRASDRCTSSIHNSEFRIQNCFCRVFSTDD
jgi:hypothetical protein